MAVKKQVTVSVQRTTRRPSSAERRAAWIATLSTQQAELKREAAERRAKRVLNGNAQAASMPRKSLTRSAGDAGRPRSSPKSHPDDERMARQRIARSFPSS